MHLFSIKATSGFWILCTPFPKHSRTSFLRICLLVSAFSRPKHIFTADVSARFCRNGLPWRYGQVMSTWVNPQNYLAFSSPLNRQCVQNLTPPTLSMAAVLAQGSSVSPLVTGNGWSSVSHPDPHGQLSTQRPECSPLPQHSRPSERDLLNPTHQQLSCPRFSLLG